MTIDLKAIEARCERAKRDQGRVLTMRPPKMIGWACTEAAADMYQNCVTDLPALLRLVREAIPCIEAYRDISAALQQVDDYQWAVEWLAKVEDK